MEAWGASQGGQGATRMGFICFFSLSPEGMFIDLRERGRGQGEREREREREIKIEIET